MQKDDLRITRRYYAKGEAKQHLASLFDPEKYPDAKNNELARIRDIFYVLKGDCDHYSLLTYHTDNDQLIGAVLWYKTKTGLSTLNDIVVLSEFQGRGLGKTFFNDFYSTIHSEGCRFIKFYSDLSSIDFYTRYGYRWLAISQSEQIPWTICAINSNDAAADCAEFYDRVLNKGVDDPLFRSEMQKMMGKSASVVTKKKTLEVIDRINKHFIEYHPPTNTLESLFE